MRYEQSMMNVKKFNVPTCLPNLCSTIGSYDLKTVIITKLQKVLSSKTILMA